MAKTKQTRQMPKVEKHTIKRLLTYLKPYRFRLILVAICIIASAIVNVMSSLFLQTLIDKYISPLLLEATPNYAGLLRTLCLMGGVFLIGVVSSLFYNRVMSVIAQGVLRNIRNEMFDHMQSLPIRYFDERTNGEVMSHYTNDADTLRQMISQSIPHIFSSIITIISVVISMLLLSLWLSLFTFALVFLSMFLVKYIAKRSGKYYIARQSSVAEFNGYIEEMMNGQKVVKVFNHEEKVKQEFDQKNDNVNDNSTLANKYASIMMPLMNNFGYILYVLVAILGAGLAIGGVMNVSLKGVNTLSLGMIASFLTLTRSFINPISQVAQQANSIIMAMAGASRIFKLLDEPAEVDDGYVTLVNIEKNGKKIIETDHVTGHYAWKHPHHNGSVTYTELKGDIEFENVTFGYTPDKIVLKNINLFAHSGEKVALVGATGAGKTTITNLLNRFYDLDSGKIRYDGINIKKIKKADLRRSMGMVLQDVKLFTGSVLDNIRYGDLNASDQNCIDASKRANADNFITMLPEGYNTVIDGEGSGLSQGQRQLVSIARAEVVDPPVMILDEATSSIDTRTEALVQRGMDALMKGRTVFVIAHRLSTIQNADNIIVLDHGEIIEQGNHDQLISQKGTYYSLYTGAFELE